MNDVVTVLIAARNRPIYLWACLDSLFRLTRHPHRFVLVDMASDDPGVGSVIEGFRRRGMFEQVLTAPDNDPVFLADLILRSLDEWGRMFAYVEADVVMDDTATCWLEQMTRLMTMHPDLAMLGSAIDKRDFIDPQEAMRISGGLDRARVDALIKTHSPERVQDVSQAEGAELFRPHNPAGRLMMIRSAALKEVGPGTDTTLHNKFRAAGYDTAVATKVRHRHLSLIQLYDYSDYEITRRDAYMNRLSLSDTAVPSAVR